MESRRLAGHLAALFTIIIWVTTFNSTKGLLTDFRPAEILFFCFVMGFMAFGLERFTDLAHLRGILYLGLGAVMAVAGLFLSEYSGKESRKNE